MHSVHPHPSAHLPLFFSSPYPDTPPSSPPISSPLHPSSTVAALSSVPCLQFVSMIQRLYLLYKQS
jgi:hypothetical protein